MSAQHSRVMPYVSIVMSVYNNQRELPRTMQSLLNQTFRGFELIVVNDGSTDGSAELLTNYAKQDPRIKVIHQENSGLGPALNRGCLMAQGQYLARQDADDISAPSRLERQVDYMDLHQNVVVCGTWTWVVDSKRGPLYAWEVPNNHALLLKYLESGDNPLIHGSAMIRKASYDQEGQGYRLRRYCEEYDLWLRLSAFGRIASLPSTEYLYWITEGGMSYGNLKSRKKLVELCLLLHRERKKYGSEITDWRETEAAILAGMAEEGTPAQRLTAAAYTNGLQKLEAGDWKGYRKEMQRAGNGQGAIASRAKFHVRLAWAAPVIRGYYAFRFLQTSRRHSRRLPIGTKLPDYAQSFRWEAI